MAAAMMAPTLIPALRTLDDLIEGGHTPDRSFEAFLGGYLLVWVAAAGLGAALQISLARVGVLDPLGESLSRPFTALLLAGAGVYQFTTLKANCLSQCRAPLMFFMQHWDEGPLRMGVRMGRVCVVCCWALMLLAFAGGMSSLALMGLATLLMTFEKLPEIGRHLTRPVGIALLGSAVWVLLS
jgi:predicted metal-binding membrane protein